MKKLVTERDILEAHRKRAKEFVVGSTTIITPAAQDAAAIYGIGFVKERSREGLPGASRRVVIGADHGGFDLKETLKDYLTARGFDIDDVGTHSTESVDYPDFAHAVAKKVADNSGLFGIVIDGAGIGSAMAANKVSGVRAAPCQSVYTARNSRLHNNANVLALGSRILEPDQAKEIVSVWLESPFEGGRHQSRVDKIMALESKAET